MPVARDLRRAGAASLDLAFVAAGRLDAYYERGLQPWDLAGGSLLVTEAGGRFARALPDDSGRAPLVLAASPGIFDELARITGLV
jgi:myo-inositol-1(or 4)-monophosphatase